MRNLRDLETLQKTRAGTQGKEVKFFVAHSEINYVDLDTTDSNPPESSDD